MCEFDLYCFAESGNAFKVALMLELSDADWKAKKIDFFRGEHRSPLYRKVNDLSEVPALVHNKNGSSRVISQSAVMLLYLAEQTKEFGPKDENERWEILKWLFYDNHKFTPANAMARSVRVFPQYDADPVIKQMWWDSSKSQNKFLDSILADRDWLVGDLPTIADISMSGYLVWPDEIGVDWSDYPNVRSWLKRLEGLPGWARPEDIMPRTL